MKEHQHNIFSVPVWGFVFNDHRYQSLDYIDAIIDLSRAQSGSQKSNIGGWQSSDDLNVTMPVLRELISAINDIANDIVKDFGCREVCIKEMWANINNHKDHNANHIHGGILSGVFYLKVPANSGRLILCNPAVRSDGHILRAKNFPIQPENLACIFFPSWLEHYVEPNLSDQSRISISFNIGVK